jgi:hypothetical protein
MLGKDLKRKRNSSKIIFLLGKIKVMSDRLCHCLLKAGFNIVGGLSGGFVGVVAPAVAVAVVVVVFNVAAAAAAAVVVVGVVLVGVVGFDDSEVAAAKKSDFLKGDSPSNFCGRILAFLSSMANDLTLSRWLSKANGW